MSATIDFNKVIQYSKRYCVGKSLSKCAQYVKSAFQAGGCKYVTGNGWNNQAFCKTNGFKCIGDFKPIDGNPRAHNGKPMQFPKGYTQQIGDICLIDHGTYGHICYAAGTGIDDWVSDYFQRAPGQMAGTGPYCYPNGYKQVQFWRHSSVMNGAPEVAEVITAGSFDYSSGSNQPIGIFKRPSGNVDVQTINGFGSLSNEEFNGYGSILGTNIIQK